MNKLLLMALTLSPLSANANEVRCLSYILFAESRGESVEGIVAVGQADVSRSKRTGLSICRINGVARKRPPDRMRSYWHGIARNILADKKKPIIGAADSWNTGTKPSMKGNITRHIGGHVYYVMDGELK